MFSSREPIVVAIAFAVLLVIITSPVRSCYSGLTVIPTTDVVGAGQYSLDLQTDGSLPVPRADFYLLNTEFGIGDRFEAGVDFDLSEDADPRVLLNAKYVFARNADNTRALAAGISSLADGVKSVPYVTGMADLRAFRLHLGMLHQEGMDRWFAGVDRELTDKLYACADYTNGDENYSSVGVNYQFTENTGVFAGVLFPNAGGDTEFTLHLVFCGSYRKE